MKAIRIIFVTLGCLHLCGGHYGLLQALAWGTMIVEYSAEKGLTQGISDTFDGEHPCDLCQSIAQAQEEEESKHSRSSHLNSERFELKPLFPIEVCTAKKTKVIELSQSPPGTKNFSYNSRSEVPTTPPPRWV